ncbi:hypothetical protein CSPX01_11056 [Colletotrichum filicis]|nr:hypothetical protein CSPX01_11056 [Colletotrichum filicis]
MPQLPPDVTTNNTIDQGDQVLMMDGTGYLYIVKGCSTLFGEVSHDLTKGRATMKAVGNMNRHTGYKILTVSAFDAAASSFSVTKSKMCAGIVMATARYYMRDMAKVARKLGFNIIYGDIDSILVHVEQETESGCEDTAHLITQSVVKDIKGTIFAKVGAGVEANYKRTSISAKKKYKDMNWDDMCDTEGFR